MRDYWRHSGNDCKNHKKVVVQLIPQKVWQLVYADYMLEFPNSIFKDDSLKNYLRDSLKDMKSSANPKDGKQAVVQDDKLMRNLMNTELLKA